MLQVKLIRDKELKRLNTCVTFIACGNNAATAEAED